MNLTTSIFDALTQPALIGGLVAFVVAMLLVLTKDWHGAWSTDSQFGIQKFHTHPTPRIGGVAIAAGAIVAYLACPKDLLHGMLWPLLLASAPAFAFGLLEDLTKRVGVLARLLATMASGAIGWGITGLSITDVQLPGVDCLLG